MPMRRRSFVSSLVGLPLAELGAGAVLGDSAPHVTVVGAGAFGGWTALNLLRSGARVTLIDAWGAGHSRSSSGGETRVIRHSYDKPIYVEMAKRSLARWREASDAWGRPLLQVSGVLHMYQSNAPIAFDDGALMKAAGIPHEVLSHDQLAERYPQVDMDGIESALYEPTAGFILARRACEAVVDTFVQEGGEYRVAYAKPGDIGNGRMEAIRLSDGETLTADQYVFACGPWLRPLFPDVLGPHLSISRQEIFYFGTPAGDHRFSSGAFPVWTDIGDPVWYGIPGGERRGFKIADDTRGPQHDPTTAERTASTGGIRAAASYIARRFPGLKDAPLIESRVCQYTNTPDGDFIADRHPRADNVWLLGGGSGHGFKHGPAFGELVASQILGDRPVEATFSLERFSGQVSPGRGDRIADSPV